MATKSKTLDLRSRSRWRAWLEANHDSAIEIWLVYHKSHTGKTSIEYEDSVEEALCFGWVDSLIRRLDDDRYARKFTPRKPDSFWSDSNRERYAKVEALGLLAPAGRERAPTGNRYPRRPKRSSAVPAYIEKAFKVGGRYKITGMFDAFNLTNSAAVTNFNLTNGASYNQIIAALDPRTLQFGLRFDF